MTQQRPWISCVATCSRGVNTHLSKCVALLEAHRGSGPMSSFFFFKEELSSPQAQRTSHSLYMPVSPAASPLACCQPVDPPPPQTLDIQLVALSHMPPLN